MRLVLAAALRLPRKKIITRLAVSLRVSAKELSNGESRKSKQIDGRTPSCECVQGAGNVPALRQSEEQTRCEKRPVAFLERLERAYQANYKKR